MTQVFILDIHADIYERAFREKFPNLKIETARNIAETPKDLSHVEVFVAFGTSINNEVLDRLTGLKWILTPATGVDHFLRWPGLKPDVILTGGRGIHGHCMRETVAYLMLGISRDAPGEVARKQKHQWERRYWSLLAGKTSVVAGSGIAGSAIGHLLQAFGQRTICVTHTPRSVEGFDEVMPTAQLKEAAARADFLVNVLPGSPQNDKLFGKDVFAAMKKSAFFINAGRGETVDEPSLIAALKEGRIAGAGLDVYAKEPLPADSPLWDMPNVFLTPHIGGYFLEYEEYVLPIFLENMQLYLAGRHKEMRNLIAH